jgi:class 3 adenylate cyclase
MTAAAPSGVVTFLFTDIEGSTRRWEADAEAMRAALLTHDEVLRTAIEAHDGFLFSHTGDGVAAAFASPTSAANAADLRQCLTRWQRCCVSPSNRARVRRGSSVRRWPR